MERTLAKRGVGRTGFLRDEGLAFWGYNGYIPAKILYIAENIEET
jgi:hypothetical protein